jgi:hypothetical protein
MPFSRKPVRPGVWYRDDVCDLLDALDIANADVAQYVPTPEMTLYRAGYEAAITAMALAFGLPYVPPKQRRLPQ